MNIRDGLDSRKRWGRIVVGTCLLIWLVPGSAAEEATVQGALVANGETVELPYVYMWPEKEGFYDPADPTWTVLFVERPISQRELGEPIWDAAWVEIGITETKEFAGQPELQVYSQSIKLSAEAGGNISGGEYPSIELEGVGSNLVSGRIWQAEPREFFDDSFQYDFTFSVSMSDPDAPIGSPLPEGGGEPGLAYLKWVEAVHAGDVEKLKSVVPSDMAAQLESMSTEEVGEEIEFMQLMTPAAVKIIEGSIDGETAVLKIEGLMDGEGVAAEVTMTRMGEYWIPTNTKM